MNLRGIVTVFAVTVVLAAGAVGRPATAWAQGDATTEKGVKATNLVTSLGPFRGMASVPIVLTGQVIEIDPGGTTGRQRHMVPSYVYVLDGTLTTNSEGGPVGVGGVQYHAAGQSYMDVPGVWHTYTNSGTTPVKYLLLLIGTPGGPTTEKAKAD
jgi:quercetin dioxygenase-like cupin family protein